MINLFVHTHSAQCPAGPVSLGHPGWDRMSSAQALRIQEPGRRWLVWASDFSLVVLSLPEMSDVRCLFQVLSETADDRAVLPWRFL